jgi:protease I
MKEDFMSATLEGKTVAILAADGFEESELTHPRAALEEAGAATRLVSLTGDAIRSWTDGNWGERFDVDETLADARADRYDALLIPGGVLSPDRLRSDEKAVAFVKSFFAARKPVAAICHGPWLLVEAGVARDRRLTSYASIRTDLQNAGARWVDEEVVVDEGLVTSRSPADLPAFSEKLVEEVGEGSHAGQST